MKFLKNLGILLLLLLFLGVLFLSAYWFSTKPIYSGSLELPKLEKEVIVNFDNYGIPHIQADSEKDLFHAFGYIHAQDRLFQMEMIKRLVNGRLSEIIGPELIETDKYMRTLGLGIAAKKSAAMYMSDQSEEYQKLATAYLEGINEFIENGKTPIEYKLLGIEKEKFTPADLYNVTAFMSLGFSAGLKSEPLMHELNTTLGPKYMHDWGDTFVNQVIPSDTIPDSEMALADAFMNVEETLEGFGIPIWEGSNAWLLSAERSASGKPILANDTHIKFSQPAVYYEAHLSCPGFEVYGNFLAGLPFPVIAHTKIRGWGLTIFPVDNLDLYSEKVNTKDENQVWINNKWTAITSRTEVLKVKGQEDITFIVRETAHGPIVNKIIKSESSSPISLRWTAIEAETQILEGIYSLIHADNIEEITQNMELIDILGLNVMYADNQDNIAWWTVGKIPLRNKGVNSNFVLDGSLAINEWQGYMSSEDHPHEVNPEKGYLVSSNNNPYEGTQRIAGSFQPIYRASRIEELLLEKEIWTPEDLKAIHMDGVGKQHLLANKSLLSYLGKKEDKYIKILNNWNGDFDLESVAPTIYTHLLHQTMRLMMVDEIGKEKYSDLTKTLYYDFRAPYIPTNENSVWWDNVSTKENVETPAEITELAWSKTINYLEKSLGKDLDKWKWKNTHQLTHVHPIGQMKPFDKLFNVGPFPVNGGNQTVNKMAFNNYEDSVYKVISGPALRTIIDFSDIDAAQSIIPSGQSGVVSSKFYQDQASMFHSGKYRGQLMNKEDIERVSTRLTLKP